MPVRAQRTAWIDPGSRAYQVYRYLTFQPQLALAMLRDWMDHRNPGSEPVPPAKLRHRVHGDLRKEGFLTLGGLLAANIVDILAAIDRDLDSFGRVLDFGCGCARVMRFLRGAGASCEFHGTDIDPEAIGWCEQNVPGVRWNLNGDEPPLPYPDGTFDLLYAISVFTHLDESLQRQWLHELCRVARPGAYLILSVHGDAHFRSLSPASQDALFPRGFLYLTRATGVLKLDGLPDYYQTACHTRDYIQREWTRLFDLVHYFERGIAGYQDAVLLRKGLAQRT